jgi:putative ABC transport system permease protein
MDASVFLEVAGGSPAVTEAALKRALAGYPTADVRYQAAAVDGRTATIDQILGLVTVLLLFTVLIALLGITNTLALSIVERTREIGLLRAVGMTRRQLRWMVRAEAVLVAALAVTLGVAVGLGFGSPLLSRAGSRRLRVCAGACRRQRRSSGGALHVDGSGASARWLGSRARGGCPRAAWAA